MIQTIPTIFNPLSIVKEVAEVTNIADVATAPVTDTFSENVRWLGRKIAQFFSKVLSWIKIAYEKIAIKVKELWPKILPYLKKVSNFIQSPLGICCISGVIVLFCVIKTMDSDTLLKKAFWITLGVISAVVLGIIAQKANFFIAAPSL